MIFRVLDSIDEFYIYNCCLWISPLLFECASTVGNVQVILSSRRGGSSV